MSPRETHQQRMEALRIANEVRTRRSILKRDLAERRVLVSEVLLDEPHPDIAGMRIGDIVRAVPRVGQLKANRVLGRCNIAPSVPLELLSQRRREVLLEHLADFVPTAPVYPEAVAA